MSTREISWLTLEIDFMFPPISPYTCITFNSVTNSKVAYVLEGKSSVGPSSETNRGLVLGESSSVFRGGGACDHVPLGTSETDTLLKMGFQTYIFCSKMPSKCRECRFRDPNFKNFRGNMPPDPIELCHHYRLPLRGG